MNAASDTVAVHQPIGTGERIQTLDIVRGFALLGIFLMNIEFFNRPMLEYNGSIWPDATGIDRIAALFVHILVTGKFWVLFSLMFGMGFVVLKVRSQNVGRGFNGFYLRRIGALALFGLAHITFFWTGDILLTYALAALPLLLLGDLQPRIAFILGVVLYSLLAGLIVFSGFALSIVPPEQLGESAGQFAEIAKQAAASAQAHAQGSYLEVTLQRLQDFSMQASNLLFFLPSALGVFLIGGAILRMGWLHDVANKRRTYFKVLAVCLPIALLFIGLSLRNGYQFPKDAGFGEPMLSMGLMMLGNLPLALCYLALLLIALGSPALAKLFSVFAPAGRMALSNYLTQSLICSIVFFGYGFGLYGQWGRAGQVGFVLGVFVLQVLFSHWWMARYRFGPMEWLWRWMSYGQRPALAK